MALLALVLLGCSAGGAATTEEQEEEGRDPLSCGTNCEPFSTQACTTLDGQKSYRVCTASGLAYYTCGTGGETRPSSCPPGTTCTYQKAGGMRCEGAGGTGSGGGGGAAGKAGAAGTGAGGYRIEEGGPCAASGALSCPALSKSTDLAGYSLRCSSGQWMAHETCDAGTYCNPWPGIDEGRCMPLLGQCTGKKLGETVCVDEKYAGKCGKNPFAFDSKSPCIWGCYKDKCGECMAGDKRYCKSPNAQVCIDGHWIPSKC